jgi:hypothetical protein
MPAMIVGEAQEIPMIDVRVGASAAARTEWLDMARLARLEVSSQHRNHPIEDAFSSTGDGWRASEPGEQVIRVSFRSLRSIGRIRLVFNEDATDRTQEFTLRWSSHRGETHREIVRQRFNFSRSGATREVAEYQVELHDVTWLELRIVADTDGGQALASLAEFRIA